MLEEGGKLAGKKGQWERCYLENRFSDFSHPTLEERRTALKWARSWAPLGERLLSKRTVPHIHDLQLRHRTRHEDFQQQCSEQCCRLAQLKKSFWNPLYQMMGQKAEVKQEVSWFACTPRSLS